MFADYRKNSPKRRKRLTLDFVFAHPAHFLATFMGSGLLQPASGTWGTLAGFLVYLLLTPFFGPFFWFCLCLLCFFIGAWACEVAAQNCGVHDHASFVIDEVFAIWLVLLCTPESLGWQLLAFAAFRVFDIVKLPPASYYDRKMRNGLGVMLDDAFAALYAIGLIRLGVWLFA
ncbi:MAG: phosphatidylglycerophosphatase A [Desulfovibrio sp.]|nr:phosphatidylglycerophosphatase A [Desulfovibrio sp.]